MSKEKVIAPERKRLSDLYVVGDEVDFVDPANPDEPVKVWIQKLTSSEEKQSIKKARPAKMEIAQIKRLPEDHPDKLYYYDKLDEGRFETPRQKLKYLVSSSVAEYAQTAEAEVANEPHWSNDDYLIELQETWNEEFKMRFATDPEDKDAKRVHDELLRYTVEVEEAIENHESLLIAEIDDLSEEEIDRKVVRKLIEEESMQEMFSEFRKWQLYFGTRVNDDRGTKYFKNREEIDTVPSEPYIHLLANWLVLNMDDTEGKG